MVSIEKSARKFPDIHELLAILVMPAAINSTPPSALGDVSGYTESQRPR